VNLTTPSGSIPASLGIAAGNTLEAIAAAWLIARHARGPACFERVNDVFRFAAICAAATTVSATIGATSLALAGDAAWAAFGGIWITWWLGDLAGALVFAPPLVLWYHDRNIEIAPGRLGETLLSTALVLATGLLCFAAPVASRYPLMFLTVPPLAWVAFRFGSRATATHLVLLAMIAVYTTEKGIGPFVLASRNESLLVLQAFMGTLALMMLPIAALLADHVRTTERLAAANTQERRARAEAEAASAAKDEFISMLSHELRNPLQAISSSAWLIQRPGNVDESMGRAVDIIRRQSEHLTRLVNDLLDAAQLITGRIALVLQPVDLAEAIRRTIGSLESAGRFRDLKLEVDAQPIFMRADPARLDQMLANLLANAAKFTPHGGTIRVSAQREGGEAVVRVRDNGVGMASELVPRVFDLFTQGHRGLDRREGGLGVGLALVQRLARLHGGEATAASDGPGRGSEFTLRFPIAERGTAPVDAVMGGPGVPRRVLIVEDHADVRHALRTLLERDGHEVFEAGDGVEGIEAAERLKPDVVLIDIGLPSVDGYKVAQALRSNRALLPKLRLVAVTGYGQPADKRRARDAGFDEHLVKPVDPAALNRALGTQLPIVLS
jgi:signal transduction histidine kinase/ActR/RegA family two-component response regulator